MLKRKTSSKNFKEVPHKISWQLSPETQKERSAGEKWTEIKS